MMQSLISSTAMLICYYVTILLRLYDIMSLFTDMKSDESTTQQQHDPSSLDIEACKLQSLIRDWIILTISATAMEVSPSPREVIYTSMLAIMSWNSCSDILYISSENSGSF